MRKVLTLGLMVGAGVALAGTPTPSLRAPDVQRCTDRGALSVWREGEAVRGSLGGLALSGTESSLRATDTAGRTVWSGALAELGGTEVAPVDPAAVAKALARLGKLKAKGDTVKGKGVKAEVDADGVLRGTWKGDRAAWALTADGAGVFGGTVPPDAPLARLPRRLKGDDPFAAAAADPVAALARVVADHARRVGAPLDCGAGGATELRLGRWKSPIPLAEGRRVAWATADEALVRGPEGAAWYLTTPMGAGQAAELAGALADSRGARVAWDNGLAAVLVTSDPAQMLPGSPVTPSTPTVPLLPLLHPDPAALRPEVGPARDGLLAAPGLDAGVEMVRRLNTVRRTAGLAPVALDAELAFGALGHCAWVDANPGADHGRQQARTPLFLAESPKERGAADELVTVARGAAPPAAVEAWIAAPFARLSLLHPAARAAGACATPSGARVMEVAVSRQGVDWEPHSYPADGMSGVPLRFDGDDPVFRKAVQADAGPFGFPITLWVDAPAVQVQVQTSQLLDAAGAKVPHFLVRGSEAPNGIDAPESTVHLVARAPLRPGTPYTWEVAYTVAGRDHVRRGRFQTAADPAATPVALDGLALRVVERLNEKRAEQSRLADLLPTAAATQGARLVAATRSNEGVDRLVPAGSAWYCAPAASFQAWLALGRDAFDTHIDPLGLDARYGQVGVATPGGDLCLLFSREGGRAPR